jgi:hypothetical protein
LRFGWRSRLLTSLRNRGWLFAEEEKNNWVSFSIHRQPSAKPGQPTPHSFGQACRTFLNPREFAARVMRVRREVLAQNYATEKRRFGPRSEHHQKYL